MDLPIKSSDLPSYKMVDLSIVIVDLPSYKMVIFHRFL